jgi:hypothetical protein
MQVGVPGDRHSVFSRHVAVGVHLHPVIAEDRDGAAPSVLVSAVRQRDTRRRVHLGIDDGLMLRILDPDCEVAHLHGRDNGRRIVVLRLLGHDAAGDRGRDREQPGAEFLLRHRVSFGCHEWRP